MVRVGAMHIHVERRRRVSVGTKLNDNDVHVRLMKRRSGCGRKGWGLGA